MHYCNYRLSLQTYDKNFNTTELSQNIRQISKSQIILIHSNSYIYYLYGNSGKYVIDKHSIISPLAREWCRSVGCYLSCKFETHRSSQQPSSDPYSACYGMRSKNFFHSGSMFLSTVFWTLTESAIAPDTYTNILKCKNLQEFLRNARRND